MSMSASPSPTFASLGLSKEALRALEQVGYSTPTPIQSRAIPPALAGRDVIGCAATGTGKTAAFTLPLIDRIVGKKGTRALVLAPTRELALQIAEHVESFGRPRGIQGATLIGGAGMGAQTQALRRGAQVIVATPGRLLDHVQQGTARLDEVELLVLDEADRMLDMGFKPQLTRILGKLPKARQTLLFSATMAGEVADFARVHLSNPERVEVSRSGTTAVRVDQRVYTVEANEKTPLLLALLASDSGSTLVFTRTKRRADKLCRAVERAGHKVARIHADRSQAQRVQALEGFRSGKYRVLVATDIAARGIDVEEIAHVVNYDLPHVAEDYVHRVGRTARAAASGTASSFASPEEADLLRNIERLTRTQLPRPPVPRDSPIFQEEFQAGAARQAHPGPPQPGHRRSGRPPGKAPGRHARSHAPKPRDSAGAGTSSNQQGTAKASGNPPSRTVFRSGPRRRR